MSFCTQVTDIYTWYKPTVFTDYPNIVSAGVSNNAAIGRSIVNVLNPPAALLIDYRYPMLTQYTGIGSPVVSDYQLAIRTCHDLRLLQITVPVTIGSITYQIPAAKVYQDYLVGVAAEVLGGATSIKIAFQGGQYTLSAANFKSAYAAYRAGLRSVAALSGGGTVDHITLRGQIESAAQISDLDAVVVN
jgi:hypothetical protein